MTDITLTKTATHTINGTTYSLDDASINGDSLLLDISMHGRGTRDLDKSPLLSPFAFRVVDGEGRQLSNNGSSVSGSGGRDATYKVHYTYSLRVRSKDFHGGEVRPGPFKLAWNIFAEVKTLKIPFEFRDVPLP